MNRHILGFTLVILSLAVLIVPLSSIDVSAHRMVKFQSYAELKSFLEDKTLSCGQQYILPSTTDTLVASTRAGPSSAGAAATPGHSETNNQVAGVNELDTVKTDGEYIYTVSNNTLVILRAYPAAEAAVVSRISVNGRLEGLFVDGTRLVLLTRGDEYVVPLYADFIATPAPMGLGMAAKPYWGGWSNPNVTAWVYDISSRDSPLLRRSVTVNGTMIGARQVGDFVYFITTTSIPRCYSEAILPKMVMNGQTVNITAPEIYHSDLSDYGHSFTIVTALDITRDSVEPTVETFLIGASSTIYVSLNNLYITAPGLNYGDETVIHRIQINYGTVVYQATGEVPGSVLNQFSMDETKGYFRVATTTSSGGWVVAMRAQPVGGDVVTPQPASPTQRAQGTNVYVLDLKLQVVGKLEGLAPGEQFHSARFLGDRAYLVTFKRIDPFFVVDLSNPRSPRLLGELKVPGFSDYLQPYDETHIIGIGRNTTDVAWENAVLADGVKVSFFDVSDPANPVETSSYTIGVRGSSSPATSDHKAVLFDRDKNLLVIPVEVAQIKSGDTGPWSYGTPVWQGAYVFKVSPQDGLVYRGGITHLRDGELPFYDNTERFVSRALYIGNVLYTISESMVKLNSLSDLAQLGSVSF